MILLCHHYTQSLLFQVFLVFPEVFSTLQEWYDTYIRADSSLQIQSFVRLKRNIGRLFSSAHSTVCFGVQVQTLAGSFKDTQTWSLSSFTLARRLVHSCSSCLRLCALCIEVSSRISPSLSLSVSSPQSWPYSKHDVATTLHSKKGVIQMLSGSWCFPGAVVCIQAKRYYVIRPIIYLHMLSHLKDHTSSLTT